MSNSPNHVHAPGMVEESREAGRSRRHPTRDDWEGYRPLIKRLYVDEGKRLHEVMTILAENGHVATAKMFKARISKWGLDKKNKEHEILAIVRKKTQRDAVGKKSVFRVRGQVKSIEDVQHYLKRKKTLPEIATSVASTPSVISCWTPSPVATPRPIEGETSINSITGESNETNPNTFLPSPTADNNTNTRLIAVNGEWNLEQSFYNRELNAQQNTNHVSSWLRPRVAIPQLAEEDTLMVSVEEESSQAQTRYFLLSPLTSDNFDRELVSVSRRTPARPFYKADIRILAFDRPSIPRSPTPPHSLLTSERLFSSIKTYIRGSFENGIWFTDENGSHGTIKPNVDPTYIWSYIQTATLMKERRLYIDFRRTLSKTFRLVGDLLQSRHPRTLETFLDILFFLMDEGHHDVAFLLRDHIKDMSSCILTEIPVLADIWQLICILDGESFERVIVASWRCNIDVFKAIGPLSLTNLETELNFIYQVHRNKDPFEAERIIRVLLNEYEKVLGEDSRHAIIITINLGHVMIEQGRYIETEELGLRILPLIQADKLFFTIRDLIEVFEVITWSQYYQHKEELAEINMREAIKLIGEEWGMENPWVIQDMTVLEGWLREWERGLEAGELKAEIDKLIGLDEIDEELAGRGLHNHT